MEPETLSDDLPNKVLAILGQVQSNLMRKWREAITGNAEIRIRDSLHDSKVVTKVKKVDSFAFSLGVVWTYLIQWTFLVHPAWFKHFYLATMLVLMPHRFFSYRAQKAHFFMLDFCYWANASVLLQTYQCSDCSGESCAAWFQMNYILTQGTLATAIYLWGNSVVFHSVDKMTSVAIHLLPTLAVFIVKWFPAYVSPESDRTCFQDELGRASMWRGFQNSCLFFFTWQVISIAIQLAYVEKHRDLVTAQRHQMGNGKNPITRRCWNLGLKLGLTKEDQLPPDVYALRTTVLFHIFEVMVVVSTMTISMALYHSVWLNSFYLVFLIWHAIQRGGTFYIHVFSQQYNKKFENRSPGAATTTPSGEPEAEVEDNKDD